LEKELQAQTYADERVRVITDHRDLRGGEKTWQHIKKGVPIRLEIGPRDVAAGGVSLARRDKSPSDKTSIARPELVATVSTLLGEIQTNLFERAVANRAAATKQINSRQEFDDFFGPAEDENAAGFALAHFHDDPAIDALLKERKLTVRCIPLAGDDEPGVCIFTGKPSPRRAVFGKAY
jgi:prolyl-tRNA synthetase